MCVYSKLIKINYAHLEKVLPFCEKYTISAKCTRTTAVRVGKTVKISKGYTLRKKYFKAPIFGASASHNKRTVFSTWKD